MFSSVIFGIIVECVLSDTLISIETVFFFNYYLVQLQRNMDRWDNHHPQYCHSLFGDFGFGTLTTSERVSELHPLRDFHPEL